MHCCVYILTYVIDIFLLHLAINYFIERLGYFLPFWCFTALIITALVTEHTKK